MQKRPPRQTIGGGDLVLTAKVSRRCATSVSARPPRRVLKRLSKRELAAVTAD